MDKHEFLIQLEAALAQVEIPYDKAVKYLKKIESTIDNTPQEEQAQIIARLGTPESIAEKLKSANDLPEKENHDKELKEAEFQEACPIVCEADEGNTDIESTTQCNETTNETITQEPQSEESSSHNIDTAPSSQASLDEEIADSENNNITEPLSAEIVENSESIESRETTTDSTDNIAEITPDEVTTVVEISQDNSIGEPESTKIVESSTAEENTECNESNESDENNEPDIIMSGLNSNENSSAETQTTATDVVENSAKDSSQSNKDITKEIEVANKESILTENTKPTEKITLIIEDQKETAKRSTSSGKASPDLHENQPHHSSKGTKAKKKKVDNSVVINDKKAVSSENQEERAPVMSHRGKRIFIIGTIATSPITLALILILSVIFIALYIATILFSCALVLVEIVGVICGVLIGITGVLYGVIGILPGEIPTYVGMYELGYGIIILGIVTVAGILIYEYIMNVTPLACRGITNLIKFTARKFKQLFVFIRKECGKL